MPNVFEQLSVIWAFPSHCIIISSHSSIHCLVFFYFVCFYLFCVKLCLFLFYLQERLVQKLICLFPSFFLFYSK